MKHKFILVICVLMCCASEVYSQDPQFTQFYANPLYLNPAFAGTGRCPRGVINYRNQWPNINGRYVTYSASGDFHSDKLAGGVGMIITNDDQALGKLKTTNVSLIYSYQAVISNKLALKFGLQGTYMQKNLDVNNLHFGDMIDPRRGFVWNTREAIPAAQKVAADFSAGMLGYGKNYFFGLSAHHINQPDEGLLGTAKLPAKFTLHGGYVHALDRENKSYFSPNVLIMSQQGIIQVNVGLYYVNGPFVAGLWYRSSDAVMPLIGIQNSFFKFGYSYDVTISELSGITGGGHEISMQFQSFCRKKAPKFKVVECPSF
ncbi:MAG: type IX secretion system membrane protein PorP/SprF [Bacteroidia bacterium]|nr:type IX secretion system membrane protein PorP/SprF [Sphingobacteriia bacterium]